MRRLAIASLVMLSSACAVIPGEVPQPAKGPAAVERIEFSRSPCRGTCPAYKFSVTSSGDAVFEGERFTRTLGRVPVQGGPDLFRNVQKALVPAEAAAGRTVSVENCQAFYSDQPVITIRWIGRTTRELSYDLGCHDPADATVRGAFVAARRAMPIKDLVGDMDF